MHKIEQRSEEFAEREYYNGSYERERLAFGYYHGATEQRQIDIEKAVNWLKNTFEGGGYVQDYQIEEFKKAMAQ